MMHMVFGVQGDFYSLSVEVQLSQLLYTAERCPCTAIIKLRQKQPEARRPDTHLQKHRNHNPQLAHTNHVDMWVSPRKPLHAPDESPHAFIDARKY